MLGNFNDEIVGLVADGRVGYQQAVVDCRELVFREFHVNNGADYLNDFSLIHLRISS